MSLLTSLAEAYHRLPAAPRPGYSTEKIGFVVALNEDGSVAGVHDLRDTDKRRSPRLLVVPQPPKKASGIKPNFLWEKTAYALGVTAGDGKRTAKEHAAFRAFHAEWLAGTEDTGLRALLRFLDAWSPEDFAAPDWPEDLRDQNLVFALAGEYRERYLHDRPAARAAWARIRGAAAADPQICLVTGQPGPVARLHPSIKGVWGAQSSGASIVSFNLDAFASYGHSQGDNAPVSEEAAFAYTTALNRFLDRDSGHRVQIGDASTVFWADASGAVADAAGAFFLAMMGGTVDEAAEDRAAADRIGDALERIRRGDPLAEVAPDLAKGVRFHVLGLAPNAARIAIRFWWQDDFGVLARNYQRFVADLRVAPAPRDDYPPLWRYLVELAVQGKRENVPPNLAGAWMQAILSGTPYPLTLLSATLMRIRADGAVNALRAGMLRAVLVRNYRREVPVALDPENRDRGYLLGRLFAVYEAVQRAALGKNVNATIRDKFYGSASATPRRVFPSLAANSVNHLARIRKDQPKLAGYFDAKIGGIADMMEPGADPFPAALATPEQALFGLGYYHQRSDFFRKPAEAPSETEAGA